MATREKAVFCFLIYEKGRRDEISSLINKVLAVAATTKPFSRFMAYIEAPYSTSSQPEMRSNQRFGEYEGNVGYISHHQVKDFLGKKRVTEDQNRKKPGHISYTPAEVLPTNTCVVVIGSRGFCATLARVHMEEISELRIKLVDILERLCNLGHYRRRSSVNHEDLLVVDVHQDSRNYITYNLRWMCESVQQKSEIVDVFSLAPREERSFRSME
ncbi:MAG TPA: hypothetical protein VGE31_00300 [Candidatus Paceibacterota bacterium]